MAGKKITALPSVSQAVLSDVVPAVQGGTTSKETLQQIFDLFVATYFPTTVANGGTGHNSLTAHGILLGNGTSPITPITLTDGQLAIGSTGLAPSPGTVVAGSGIIVTNGPGTITISATGNLPILEVTTATYTMSPNMGYIANNAGGVTFLLPASMNEGDQIEVDGKGAGVFKITQNSGQIIHFDGISTTLGVVGSLAPELRYESIALRCITANTEFTVIRSIGNIDIT